MDIAATPIAGVKVVSTAPFEDARGAFARWFCESELSVLLDGRRIAQINHSRTHTAGAVRGFHYQHPPHAEMKLIRCLRGRVWDVAVDLRRGSATFLRWHAQELTPGNGLMMVIPEGCAHGFQALDADSELLYLHTAAYAPGAEGGVRHDEPLLGVAWLLPVADLSARDRQHPLLLNSFQGITA
ncbi:MAG: dTDP-4-dehydrorhamnose 3,5-epimerase family protein [Candidatus Methylumidiphilus sp.]